MKKYIYGTLLIAIVMAIATFFFRPPETANRAASTVLAITFRLPESYEFTAQAPFRLTWRAESPEGMLSGLVADRNFNPFVSPYKLVFAPAPGSAAVLLNARLYYCQKTSRMCFQDDFQARVPLDPGTVLPIPHEWEIIPKKQEPVADS